MRIFAFLFLLIFAISCETSENQIAEIDSSKYSLEIVDSIQMDRLIGTPAIVSSHPKNGNLLILANERDQPMILIISQDGKIVQEFKYPKEGPNSAGPYLISANFFEDGYVILGYGSLVIYDADFNVNKKFSIPFNVGSTIYQRSNHLKIIQKDGRPHFLIFYGQEEERSVFEAEYYDEYNLLTLVDPEHESFESYGSFHDGSMFKSGRAFYNIRVVFETIGSKTKVLASNDTVLYTFDNVGNELNRVTVPFDNYLISKGFLLGERSYEELTEPSDIPGSILSLLYVDGMDVISYTSGIPLDKMTELFGPNHERYNRNDAAKINPQKVVILRDGKLVSDIYSLPDKIVSMKTSDLNGNIWASQNVNALSEEPEVVTIYKLRIVEN